ncbi:MAG: amidohydrolase [Clostridiales bacterium]|nr:amidohydrolase [Clostridiales bacterium]
MKLFNEALEINDVLVAHRRYLHQHAETGLELPETAAYVEAKLIEMGYKPERIGDFGVVATVGKPDGKCILLRGDMDALPIVEATDLEFKSTNGAMHACGHDLHATNLLGAAQLLKTHENELDGMVKLMFQPAEETMDGAKMMVEGGITNGVDAAVGMHVFSNTRVDPGVVLMLGSTGKMAAVDWFTIRVRGKGCHGASSNKGVDPINVMAHIHIALQAVNAREMDPTDNIVLTIGEIHSGNTSNVIPEEGYMAGTIRTLKNETRAFVKERMEAIVSGIAASFRAEAHVEWGSGCPVLLTDAPLYADIKKYLGTLEGVPVIDYDEIGKPMTDMGSEDFAYVANEVPSVFLGIGAGNPDEGYNVSQHNPKTIFDERALPYGAAVYAHIAIEWLKDHK